MSPRQRTLTNFVRGRSITVRMTSCLTGLESTKLLNFYLIQHKQSSRILNSQTGGHPYSDASPYVLSECSLPWIGHCLYKKNSSQDDFYDWAKVANFNCHRWARRKSDKTGVEGDDVEDDGKNIIKTFLKRSHHH